MADISNQQIKIEYSSSGSTMGDGACYAVASGCFWAFLPFSVTTVVCIKMGCCGDEGSHNRYEHSIKISSSAPIQTWQHMEHKKIELCSQIFFPCYNWSWRISQQGAQHEYFSWVRKKYGLTIAEPQVVGQPWTFDAASLPLLRQAIESGEGPLNAPLKELLPHVKTAIDELPGIQQRYEAEQQEQERRRQNAAAAEAERQRWAAAQEQAQREREAAAAKHRQQAAAEEAKRQQEARLREAERKRLAAEEAKRKAERERVIASKLKEAEKAFLAMEYQACIVGYEEAIGMMGWEINSQSTQYFIALNKARIALIESDAGNIVEDKVAALQQIESELGSIQQVQHELQGCLQLEPENREINSLLSKVDLILGRKTFEMTKLKQKILAEEKQQQAEEAQRLEQEKQEQAFKAKIEELRGKLKTGEPRLILAEYDKLIEQRPDYTELYLARGYFCMITSERVGNDIQKRVLLQKAQVDLNRVLQRDPFNSKAVTLLEQVNQTMGAAATSEVVGSGTGTPMLELKANALSAGQRAKLEAIKAKMQAEQQGQAGIAASHRP